MTLLECLAHSLRSRLRPLDGEAAPAALLWADPERQWAEAIAPLRRLVPELFVLGDGYAPEAATGPAIWLRCVVDRAVPEAPASAPILYLPRVSRPLDANSTPGLQPLVELQYRGAVWSQSGHDWTVAGFLRSREGLALQLADDAETEAAALRCLGSLVALGPSDLAPLRDRPLHAGDFDRILNPDPDREFLRWLSDPATADPLQASGRWDGLVRGWKKTFDFAVDSDPPEKAVAAIAAGGSPWDGLWARFAESPHLYPGLAALLARPAAAPRQAHLAFTAERSPEHNRQQEALLKEQIRQAAVLPQHQSAAQILKLESEHALRRDWAWARLGQAPWAMALAPLAELARVSAVALVGASPEVLADAYAEHGWRCDLAAIEALASFRAGADGEVASAAVRTLYQPWLDAAARAFQSALALSRAGPGPQAVGEKSVCILFVDGLRLDLAQRLATMLEARSLLVRRAHRIAPLPTVTATAKPAAAPLPSVPFGNRNSDFAPSLAGRPLIAAVLRRALEEAGVQVLDRDARGDAALAPLSTAGGGWLECGRIDQLGHALQADLARQVVPELDQIAERVVELLKAGWMRVRIVTDHGWLLLPGGLPKIELAAHLAATKWSRCAIAAGPVPMPTFPWRWDPAVEIACPPGIGAFTAGLAYAHGGASPQESVVPELTVEPAVQSARARIQGVVWRGLRCRIAVANLSGRVIADLRAIWNDSSSSLVDRKEIPPSGEVALLITNDSHLHRQAYVVLLDDSGAVLAQEETTIAGRPKSL